MNKCLQIFNEWVESTMKPITSLNEWSQRWNQYEHLDSQNGAQQYLKFYNIHWIRGLHARKSTIMNEWCLQWPEVASLNKWSQQWYQYQHSWRSEVTHILKCRILNEWSWQWSQHPDSLRNSIILTELDDYRHEYLRLWMSVVFNDLKFTSLNKWSQQWKQYQHSWQSVLTNILKFRILNE